MREQDRRFIELTDEANKIELAAYELLEARALCNLSVDDFTNTIIRKQKLQSFLYGDKKVEHQQIVIFKNWVAATYYYLYKQAGYPFGNNSAGFNLWMNTNIKTPFEDFCKECEEADNLGDG